MNDLAVFFSYFVKGFSREIDLYIVHESGLAGCLYSGPFSDAGASSSVAFPEETRNAEFFGFFRSFLGIYKEKSPDSYEDVCDFVLEGILEYWKCNSGKIFSESFNFYLLGIYILANKKENVVSRSDCLFELVQAALNCEWQGCDYQKYVEVLNIYAEKKGLEEVIGRFPVELKKIPQKKKDLLDRMCSKLYESIQKKKHSLREADASVLNFFVSMVAVLLGRDGSEKNCIRFLEGLDFFSKLNQGAFSILLHILTPILRSFNEDVLRKLRVERDKRISELTPELIEFLSKLD